jgi:hypothetical protein
MTDSNQATPQVLLTVEDTLSIAKLLLKTNKSISTLEVKLVARSLGFYAEQKEVSHHLNSIYRANDDLNLIRQLDETGTYYEYMLNDGQSRIIVAPFNSILNAIENLKNMATEIIGTDSSVDEYEEEEDFDLSKDATILNLNTKTYIQPTQAKYVNYPEPGQYKVQAEPALVLNNRMDVQLEQFERPELWMVAFDILELLPAEVYYIGDGIMNMDRVRSVYARRQKIAISEVRARLLTIAHKPYISRSN